VNHEDAASIRTRLTAVRDRIARAAERAKRDPAGVRLIAVSKTFDADAVRAAADAGQADFGENKVQEALLKMDRTSDLRVRWHLIGHLQTNKAKKAGGRFDVIHSLDSADLLRKLDDAASADGRKLDVLIQVDLAGESTKHGVSDEELEPIFRAAGGCRAARLIGLMIIPPAVEDPNGARPYFRELQQVRERLLASGVDQSMLAELSMGMSHDFEAAVEEGATLVRVGTAIFGSRTYA
jgi:pyridoxal phosphate enzyme (YggS family)